MTADWTDHAVKAKKKHKHCHEAAPREDVTEGIVVDGPNAGEFRRIPGYRSPTLTADGLTFCRIVIPDNFNGRGVEVGFWYDPEEARCSGLTPQAHALAFLREAARRDGGRNTHLMVGPQLAVPMEDVLAPDGQLSPSVKVISIINTAGGIFIFLRGPGEGSIRMLGLEDAIAEGVVRSAAA